MTKTLIFALLVTIVTTSSSSPLPSSKNQNNKNIEGRVLYDQRQEGEWNVRADLKNFVILIIPTQSSTSAPSNPASGGLFDFLTKSVPKKPHHSKRFHHNGNHHHQIKKNHQVQEEMSVLGDAAHQETRHFIESKSAPYHVDITKSRSHLAKLHPVAEPIIAIDGEEIVIAKSPSVAVVKGEPANAILETSGGRVQSGRAYVLTVPNGDEKKTVEMKKTEDEEKNGKISMKDEKKKVKEEVKPALALLGAENEQCGPGISRDGQGICRITDDNSRAN